MSSKNWLNNIGQNKFSGRYKVRFLFFVLRKKIICWIFAIILIMLIFAGMRIR